MALLDADATLAGGATQAVDAALLYTLDSVFGGGATQTGDATLLYDVSSTMVGGADQVAIPTLLLDSLTGTLTASGDLVGSVFYVGALDSTAAGGASVAVDLLMGELGAVDCSGSATVVADPTSLMALGLTLEAASYLVTPSLWSSLGVPLPLVYGSDTNFSSTMGPNLITSTVRSPAFSTRGTGKFSAEGKLTGRQGSIDLWVTTGATGSARSLIVLTNGVTNNFLEILLDTNNRVSLIHRSEATAIVAQDTAQFAAEPVGTRMNLRYVWDSTQAVDVSTRFAVLYKNNEKIATWATDPTAAWDSFFPTLIYVGVGSVATGGDFNGTVDKVQVGTA